MKRRPLIPRSADDRAGLDIARRLRQGMKPAPSSMPVGLNPEEILDRAALLTGMLALGAGRLHDAGDIAVDLLRRYPTHPEAMYLGAMVAWWQYDDMTGAAELLEKVVADRPRFALALYNLAYFWQRMGRDADAAALNERAIAEDPNLLGAYVNLGNARLSTGDVEGALAAYAKAATLDSTDPLALYNRGIARLLRGEWEAGWKDYETRWQMPIFRARCPVPDLPRWDGGELPEGHRLLVVSEQGLGDTIFAYRYASVLEARFPGRVRWYVQAPLSGLLAATPEGDPYPEAEVYVPTMSLPMLCGVVQGGAYLPAEPNYDACEAPLRRVGYVWAGSTTHENDRRRSTPREMWGALLATPEVEWVELQVGRGGLYQPKDWEETAQLVGTLDLVITVDTAVAHLAGAMGVPVWILLPALPDYRWGLSGDTTPWYPSARLFRCERDGAWPDVLERVRSELVNWRQG